jgi:hypothetical protein
MLRKVDLIIEVSPGLLDIVGATFPSMSAT